MPWHFFIRGLLGVLRGYLSPQCLLSTGAQTVWNFGFCCFSDPHYFLILRVVSFILLFDPRSYRGTYWVNWWKWGVLRQINIGLQIFSHLQKKIIFVTTYKFQRALFRQNFEFLPWIKILYCFQKKFLISKSKSRNSALDPAVFKISNVLVAVAPNIFKFHEGSVLFTFCLLWF